MKQGVRRITSSKKKKMQGEKETKRKTDLDTDRKIDSRDKQIDIQYRQYILYIYMMVCGPGIGGGKF